MFVTQVSLGRESTKYLSLICLRHMANKTTQKINDALQEMQITRFIANRLFRYEAD